MRHLLIGCGRDRRKLITAGGESWDELVTLDIEPSHRPDLVWDLENLPLPFAPGEFSEIHAYEVLEHTGRQGDYRFFFAQWSEFWRLLRPAGLFCGTVPLPRSKWAWGDPSHSRLVTREQLTFLDQTSYREVGSTTMSDFRPVYKADFEIEHLAERGGNLWFVLRAIKPARRVDG